VLTPTLDDLVGFTPVPNVDHMQPNGWFIAGLDANFYATGGAGAQTGTLLGQPASVRFTPIQWRWTYGDGSSTTRSTRGSTWQAQGIREFDPTPTSHVYELPGTYYIDLTVAYRADYSFDGSNFARIPGVLWVPANRLVATVGGAKTVLVERDCTISPAGPGC
jgi:PKD repeat protein